MFLVKTGAKMLPSCQKMTSSSIVKHFLFRSKKTDGGRTYDEESDHSNKAVRKTPEIESGHKVSAEVK